MAAQLPYDERLLELLSLRAIEGLDDAEQEEVQRLGSAYPEFDAEELDRAAFDGFSLALRVLLQAFESLLFLRRI